MSGDVVNLRLARKAKARAETASQAAANRVRFGRTKAARASEAHEAERATARTGLPSLARSAMVPASF